MTGLLRSLRLAAVAALFLGAAGPALASDYRGLLSVTMQWMLVIPWVVAALVVTLARFRDYRDGTTAWRHARIAAIGPLLGFAAVMIDPIDRDDQKWLFGFDAIALALTLLPLVVHVVFASRSTPTPED